MPQLQVIGRQISPETQVIQQGFQGLNDTLIKQQAMKLTAQELGIKAKQAQSEQDKVKNELASKLATEFSNTLKEGGDETVMAAKMNMIKNSYFGGDGGAMMNYLGYTGETYDRYIKMLTNSVSGTSESASRGAESRRDIAEGQATDLGNDITRRVMGMGGGTASGATNGAARANVMNGGAASGQMRVPPGTTMKAGPLNIPLNPPLSNENNKIMAGGELVDTSVTKALELIGSGTLDMPLTREVLDSGNAYLATGELETLMSEINNLKSMIPFAKGGKQLTPFEASLLFRLVDTRGKSLKTIKTDLKRFKKEFNNLRSGVIEGSGAFGGGIMGNMDVRGQTSDIEQTNPNDPLGIL